MPYLKSPQEVIGAIGQPSIGPVSTAVDGKLIAMLDACHTKIEDKLNIPTLERFGYTETFKLDPKHVRNSELFRLHAGFIDPTSVVVTAPSGEVLNSDSYGLNAELGTITMDYPIAGKYTIQYNAGFLDDGATPAVYIGTPRWLRSLLDPIAVLYLRTVTVATPKIPDGMSFEQIMAPVYRDIADRVYNRYMRPRARVITSYGCTPSAPFPPPVIL